MARIQWSKLKKNVEGHFADAVKGRVGLHSTRYRTMHDHDGRAWITLDGEEIVNMVHIWKWLYAVERRAAQLAGIEFKWGVREARHLEKEAERSLEEESFFTQVHLGDAMHRYLSMAYEDILHSESPVIRSLGMLDRRLGVRRLKAMTPEGMHPLVKTMFLFRQQAEKTSRAKVGSNEQGTPNQAL
jgi:hypothetical protein